MYGILSGLFPSSASIKRLNVFIAYPYILHGNTSEIKSCRMLKFQPFSHTLFSSCKPVLNFRVTLINIKQIMTVPSASEYQRMR